MRIHAAAILALSLIATPVFGQQDFQEFVQSQKHEYTQFRKQKDKKFHRFLKRQWDEFRMMSGKQEDPQPKPEDVPKATLPQQDEKPISSASREEDGPEKTKPLRPDASKTSLSEPRIEPWTPSPDSPEAESVTVDFLGHSLSFRVVPAWTKLSSRGKGKEQIRHFWKNFASLDSEPILSQLRQYEEELALGDWGRLLLTHRLARAVIESRPQGNEALLLTWGWLLKGGKDVRVALSDGNVVLMYRSLQEVFQVPYFHLQGSRYYVFGEKNPSRISTYQGKYQGARSAVDFRQKSRVTGRGPRVERELAFRFREKKYRVNLALPKARIRFLDTLPQLPLRLYFDAQPEYMVTKSLVQQLEDIVSPMSQQEAANFILRFVQKAFEYEIDGEQFGEENYLYPEETLYYPASDCEDRAILFTTLIRKVLGLDVAALDYPGHVATALDVPLSGEGSRVTFEDRTLVVADPTYINARLGMIMPDFADEEPRVLPLWESPTGDHEG